MFQISIRLLAMYLVTNVSTVFGPRNAATRDLQLPPPQETRPVFLHHPHWLFRFLPPFSRLLLSKRYHSQLTNRDFQAAMTFEFAHPAAQGRRKTSVPTSASNNDHLMTIYSCEISFLGNYSMKIDFLKFCLRETFQNLVEGLSAHVILSDHLEVPFCILAFSVQIYGSR